MPSQRSGALPERLAPRARHAVDRPAYAGAPHGHFRQHIHGATGRNSLYPGFFAAMRHLSATANPSNPLPLLFSARVLVTHPHAKTNKLTLSNSLKGWVTGLRWGQGCRAPTRKPFWAVSKTTAPHQPHTTTKRPYTIQHQTMVLPSPPNPPGGPPGSCSGGSRSHHAPIRC